MTRWFVRSLWATMIALFLLAQGVTLAHAVESTGEDHYPECITCELATNKAEKAVITPPAEPLAVAPLPLRETGFTMPVALEHRDFDGRAPPLRGPPA